MRILRQIPLPHWGTAVSSLLIVAAFPPWDFRFLAWFCLIPWLFTLARSQSLREALWQGVWFSVLMSWLGFHWVAYVLHEFGGVPWIVAIIGLGLYSVVGQPQFLIFAPIFHSIWRRSFGRGSLILVSIALALFYAGVDWSLPKLFKDTLGHAFYSASWLRQVAELGGPHLLTFSAIWMNLAVFVIACSYRLPRENRKASPVELYGNLASAVAVALVCALFGFFRAKEWREKLANPRTTIQAAVIQANIGDFDKVAAERGIQGAAERILADYFALSNQALSLQKKPDFVIWPETAYASTYRKPMTAADLSRDSRIEAWVKQNHEPLLFGSYDRNDGRDYNAFFVQSPLPLSPTLLDPTHSVGGDLQFYYKNILLMFGEYIPLQDYLPAIGKLFPQVANFGRGTGPHLIQIPILSQSPAATLPASPLICYEVLFPDYVLQAAKQGSRMILNITNDSWFGPYGEPHLHLALSVFRSVETRLPMIRATNTGFSALITPDGEIASKSRLSQPEILNVTVPLIDPPKTLIKTWGDWFGMFALLSGITGIAGFLRLSKT